MTSPAAVPTPGPAHHVPALDGLRGLAIAGVMLFHMTILTSNTLVDRVWLHLIPFGWAGVDLFFVLSGFLITGILLDAKGGRGYFRSFYIRRILRIFPLYYAVVTFSLLILPHIHNAKSDRFGQIKGDEIWYWTYLSNFIIAYRNAFRHGILDVSWTLAIEEQFYLLWPAIVLVLSRRALLWFCGLIVAVAFVTRVILIFRGASLIQILVLTPARMDTLAIGAAAAVVVRGAANMDHILSLARGGAWIFGGLILLFVAVNGSTWNRGLGQSFGYPVLAAFFACALLVCLRLPADRGVGRLLSLPILRQLGRYSYAIYLFNEPLRAVIRDAFYGPSRFLTLFGSQLPGQLIFYAIGFPTCFIAGALSWHLFEKHFLRLKRLFPMPRVQQRPPNI